MNTLKSKLDPKNSGVTYKLTSGLIKSNRGFGSFVKGYNALRVYPASWGLPSQKLFIDAEDITGENSTYEILN